MTAPSRWQRDGGGEPRAAAGWTLTGWGQPAALFGSNGIRIGPDGRLWIAEALGDRVSALDVSSGALETVVAIGDPILSPDDLAFDAAGTLYASEFEIGRVSRRRADGAYAVLLAHAPGANGITVDQGGRLFVTEFRQGGRLIEIDPAVPERVRVVADGLDWPNGFDRAPDGRFFVQDVHHGTLFALDGETGQRRILADDLELPSSVKLDTDGQVLVAEAFAGRLTAVDPASGRREVRLESPGIVIDNFCFDAAGALYLSSFADGRIVRHRRRGGVLDPVGETLVEGGLLGPFGLARLGPDRLLAADHTGLVILDMAGRRTAWRTPVACGPTRSAVAIDERTALVLFGSGAVHRIGRDGKARAVIAGSSATGFDEADAAAGARALAADGTHLFVAMNGGEIRQIDGDGRALAAWPAGVARIDGLAAAGGRLAATDARAGTVTVLHQGQARTIGGLQEPKGVAFFDGALVVAEQRARRITRLALDGSGRATVASDLPFNFPVPSRVRPGRGPTLLSWSADTLIVGCDGDGSIRRLGRR